MVYHGGGDPFIALALYLVALKRVRAADLATILGTGPSPIGIDSCSGSGTSRGPQTLHARVHDPESQVPEQKERCLPSRLLTKLLLRLDASDRIRLE
jgi:hypothetical protein